MDLENIEEREVPPSAILVSISAYCLLTYSWSKNNYMNKTILRGAGKSQNNFHPPQYFSEVEKGKSCRDCSRDLNS